MGALHAPACPADSTPAARRLWRRCQGQRCAHARSGPRTSLSVSAPTDAFFRVIPQNIRHFRHVDMCSVIRTKQNPSSIFQAAKASEAKFATLWAYQCDPKPTRRLARPEPDNAASLMRGIVAPHGCAKQRTRGGRGEPRGAKGAALHPGQRAVGRALHHSSHTFHLPMPDIRPLGITLCCTRNDLSATARRMARPRP